MSIDKPFRSHETKETEKIEKYLSNLGLSIEDLKGKKILDVGAGDGAFVRFANTHGADAIALDNGNNLGADPVTKMHSLQTPFALGDAAMLPFADNSFDLVVSHAAIPNIAVHTYLDNKVEKRNRTEVQQEKQQRRIKSLQEMLRIITRTGEARCAPVGNDPTEAPRQTIEIREAISRLVPYAEIIEEPISETGFRLILRKKAAQAK